MGQTGLRGHVVIEGDRHECTNTGRRDAELPESRAIHSLTAYFPGFSRRSVPAKLSIQEVFAQKAAESSAVLE